MNNKQIIKRVKAQVKKGATLQASIEPYKITYSQWRTILLKEDDSFDVPRRGKIASVYTAEKTKIIKKRIKGGEYLKDICADMGIDPRNFARFCRYQGIKIFTKKAMKANYKKRGESPRVYKKREPSKKYLMIVSLIKRGYKDATVADKTSASMQYVHLIRSRLA